MDLFETTLLLFLLVQFLALWVSRFCDDRHRRHGLATVAAAPVAVGGSAGGPGASAPGAGDAP